jgi:eukaryotic-like serine/threonine-protein kinase
VTGAPQDRLPAGLRIASRYTIESVIGEGASGTVYRATRDEDRGHVALKVIHRHLCGDRQIFRRYHREAAILKRLTGSHLVGMLDFIEEDGLLMIALEHIDGASLEDLLRAHAPLDVDRAVDIALEVCSALDAAHGAGVVHRDLKPANVLIERAVRAGGASSPPQGPLSGRVRVVDFGLAKVVHGEQMTTGLTEQDMIFGTPEYMAPEQVRGEDVDPRSDIYALGCMLYEMAVGAVPFERRTAIAVMTAQLTEPPVPPRAARPDGSISAAFDAVILRALAKVPAERHQSARAFAEALHACRERRVVARSGEGITDPISRTDLHLDETALDFDADSPAALGRARREELGLARTVQAGGVVDLQATPRRPSAAPEGALRERVLWIVVAVVFAALGAALGVVFGTR